LLVEEIELRRHLTRVAEQRRALPPGPVIEKDYRFVDANGADLGYQGTLSYTDRLKSSCFNYI
jgi:predicted dithiol-disulfide oxidoreductase (DUF899 family)